MDDPTAHLARTVAGILEGEGSPAAASDVEAALHQRETLKRPDQYFDPISLGSLIVSIATLAWTVYNDLKTKTPDPAPEVVARTIRVRMADEPVPVETAQRDHLIDLTAQEVTREAVTD
jgi:hypothetical protein